MSHHAPQPRAHRADTLVARDRERALFAESLERVARGQSEIVLISGEPGIGKSRLVRDFLATLEDPATVLNASCYEDTATPFAPILTALREVANDPPPGFQTAMERQTIRELIDRRITGAGLTDDPNITERLTDHLVLTIQDLAAERPTILAFDDAQWASEPDLDFIRYLLRSSARLPILVLLSYRDTDLGTDHPLQHLIRDAFRNSATHRVSLSRLDEHGARQLIGNVLGSPAHAVTRPLAQAIQQEAEGVPFFIEELVLHLHETGGVIQHGKNWALADASGIAIPQSIRGVVGHRLRMLDQPAQDTLSIAAVIGNEFPLDLIIAVSGRTGGASSQEIGAHLAQALERSLIVERRRERWGIPETRFAFAHDQIRDVLYSDLNAIRRRILHQATGEALESTGDAREPGHHAALAFHFGAGEDIDRASAYSEQAGDAAAELGAFRQAANHFSAALEIHTLRRGGQTSELDAISRELRLLKKREAVFSLLNDPESQWRDLERWRDLAASSEDQEHIFAATDRLTRFAVVNGDESLAGEHAHQLIDLAGNDPQRELQAWIRRGEAATGRLIGDPARLYRPAPRLQSARDAFAEALERCDAACPEFPVLLMELGVIDWELAGEDDRIVRANARQSIADALEQFRNRRDDRGEVTALIALAYRRTFGSQQSADDSDTTPFVSFLEEIRRLRSQEQRLIRESDRASNEARAALSVHVHCREFGIQERALARGIDALNWAEAAGDRRIAFYALGGLSQTEIALGRPANALDYAERALAVVESGSAPVPRNRALQWLGVASIAAGQRDRGLDLLRSALDPGSREPPTPSDLETMSLLARALAENSRDDDVREARTLAERIELATDGLPGSVPWSVDALLVQSILNRQAGNHDQAVNDASSALARFRERKITIWRLGVEAPYRFARALIDLGRSREAIEPLTEAADLLNRSAMRISDSELRASFLEQTPLHREIYHLSAEAGVWPGDDPAPRNLPRPGGLSRREAEVLGLVAIGKTNRDIADELFISEKTVARHLTNIFNKIGAESRTQAAAWAYRNAVA